MFPEFPFKKDVQPTSDFDELERQIITACLIELAQTDFDKTISPGRGPHLGLTNYQVGMAINKFGNNDKLDEKDMWAIDCAVSEISIHIDHVQAKEDPILQVIVPRIDRLKGKILRYRGFDNK